MLIVCTPGLFVNLLSLKWGALNADSILTGFLGNPLLFGKQKEEQLNLLNLRAEHMIGGKTAASDKDTQEILKITVNPPLDNASLPNLKTMEIHASVILPEGTAFLGHLRTSINVFEGFQSM